MIGFLIIGESFQFYLSNFESGFYHTTMYLQDYTTQSEMINDILNSSEHHNVEVFAIESHIESTLLNKITIYCTSGVEKYINTNLEIFQKKYHSIFTGTTQVDFRQFNKIPNIENVNNYYLIGNAPNVEDFKVELINKYAGNHPKAGNVNKESSRNIILIWSLIIIVILLLSFYDVIYQKKENYIRITLGERIGKIILKNIILDSIIYTSIFTVTFILLSRYSNIFFKFRISLCMFCIMLITNALLYISLYFGNIKEIFSNVKASIKLLTVNYGLKLITVIITVVIISSNIALIFECINFYKQRTFFEKYANYYYINLDYKTRLNSDGSIDDRMVEAATVREKFYKKFFNEFDATMLANISYSEENNDIILANRNALNYLQSNITEIKNQDLKKDIYFLLPKKLDGKSELIDDLNNKVELYEGNSFQYNFEVIYYQNNIEIMNIDEFFVNGSKLVKNPIIIINNIIPNKVDTQIYESNSKSDYEHDIMYKIDKVKFDEFISAHSLEDQICSKTNVLEKYEYRWKIVKRILYMNIVLSILILFLEFIVIKSIIRLEYDVYAIELSIKKVLGYSMLEKNRKIFLLTIFTTLTSIIIAFTTGVIMNIVEARYFVIGGSLILFLEVFIIFFYINKLESSNIQKILKGGSL